MLSSEKKYQNSKVSGRTSRTRSQTADLDEASVILSGLQTSEDAINFFARYGSETGVKFIHLQELKHTKEYAPYDLVRIEGPVPLTEVYYTMSPAGIVCNSQVRIQKQYL